MKKQNLAIIILSLLLMFTMTACGQAAQNNSTAGNEQKPASDTGKLAVYTSIYPLYFVASKIGGEHASVKNIVPAGTEPHDFEPTAKDIVDMSKAQVFIYNGSGFESWIEKAMEGFDQSKMVIVNATEGMQLLEASNEEHGHDEHGGENTGEEAKTDHEHGELNPHVWLDPSLLKVQAEKVRDAFIKADQAHSEVFNQNYEKLAADLDALDQEFKDMVAKTKQKEFMVSHSAFSYLAHKYGLEQVPISGLSPADEPSPAEMKELVEHVKEHNIKYVMFETLVSPKVAEVIAREAGVKTAVLNPLEGLTVDEEKAGKNYLTIMRENLETLRTALQ